MQSVCQNRYADLETGCAAESIGNCRNSTRTINFLPDRRPKNVAINTTSTVSRVGGFVFYNLRFFSSLRALTCQALSLPAPIGVCAPVPASLRLERVLGFRASKSCAGVGP